MDEITLEKFLKNVIKTDNCWLWSGYKDEDGYGKFYFKKKKMDGTPSNIFALLWRINI